MVSEQKIAGANVMSEWNFWVLYEMESNNIACRITNFGSSEIIGSYYLSLFFTLKFVNSVVLLKYYQ